MKKISIAVIVALISARPLFSAEFTFVNDNPKLISQERLYRDLQAAGFILVKNACRGKCTVTVSDAKIPDRSKSAALFASITNNVAGRHKLALQLVQKLNLGTATPNEKDQLLGILASTVLEME